jgi:HEAT repeat protein
MPRIPSRPSIAVPLLLLTAFAAAQNPDPAAQLRAKEIDKRLAAIDAVAASGKKDAELTLQPLLRDADWEVQEHTARALGRLKSKSAMAQLTDMAVDGDIVRIRRAAALAAAEIDAADAANRIFKKTRPKSPVESYEALALVLRGQPPFADADKLKKMVRDPNALIRESAAVAWFEGAADRGEAFRTLMKEPPLALRCRVLEAIEQAPRPGDLDLLIPLLEGPGLHEVVGRRLLRAIAAVLTAGAGDRAAADALLQRSASEGLVLARRARLLPLLARGDKPLLDQAAAVAALKPSLQARDGSARGAAVRALREIGGDAALQAALAHLPNETDPGVQLQVVETVTTLRPPTTPEAVDWLVKLAGNGAVDVRERAIVRLGKSGVKGAADVLIAALRDSEWTLACCAAVSLGKTDDDRAFEPLTALLQNTDWKLRGAAIVGLMHWSRETVMEPVLGMLADANPVVAGAAHHALRVLSRRYDAPADQKAWRAWWTQAKGKHDFTDREAAMDKLKKYGYAVPDSEIYQGLDVVVFQSRGDHIEQLLERLEIAHRKTEKSQVTGVGIHPEAIFVANCTGELAAADVEPLAWFVRTGGSLFGSCWALTETIARIHPGVMQLATTRDQVMDDVRAMPCRADSPLLNGVFPPSVVPIYHLEGSHLIQVLDPERCEVLIDSPDAAERWGCGNLAAWFHSGHGVLFDSSNHFDLQGLERVIGLKTDKDRQAYAIDHMGMTLATWRTTKTEAYWKSPPKASKSVPDLSAFRLLTNFVRSKRSGAL